MGNEFKGPIIAQQARSEPLMAAMLNFNVNLELESYRICIEIIHEFIQITLKTTLKYLLNKFKVNFEGCTPDYIRY